MRDDPSDIEGAPGRGRGRAGDRRRAVGGDERQRGIDRDATAITGLVMVFAALTGAIVQTGRSANPGA